MPGEAGEKWRVRLRESIFGRSEVTSMGKSISVQGWTVYEDAHIRDRYGENYDRTMGTLLGDPQKYVERWQDGRWVPASSWAVIEQRVSGKGKADGQRRGRRRRPEADTGLLAACLLDCENYPGHRAERVLELVRGGKPSSIHVLASQGRKRRREIYGETCPLHPAPEHIGHWIDVEKRLYSDEMAADD